MLKHIRQIIEQLREHDITATIVRGRQDGHLKLEISSGTARSSIVVSSSPRTAETCVENNVRRARKLIKEKTQ